MEVLEPRGLAGAAVVRDGKERRIVAHAGVWPVTVRNGASRERGVHMIDWGRTGGAGAGVSLLQRLTKEYDFVYSIGGSETTQSVLPRFGFRTVAEAPIWARRSAVASNAAAPEKGSAPASALGAERLVVEKSARGNRTRVGCVEAGAGGAEDAAVLAVSATRRSSGISTDAGGALSDLRHCYEAEKRVFSLCQFFGSKLAWPACGWKTRPRRIGARRFTWRRTRRGSTPILPSWWRVARL